MRIQKLDDCMKVSELISLLLKCNPVSEVYAEEHLLEGEVCIELVVGRKWPASCPVVEVREYECSTSKR